MKTKTIKASILAAIACFMSFAVVMSAAHVKDIVKDASHDASAASRSADPAARAIGDLHSHTDKQMLKAVAMDKPVAARVRELNALNEDRRDRGIGEIIEETIAFYRLAFAMRLSLAIA